MDLLEIGSKWNMCIPQNALKHPKGPIGLKVLEKTFLNEITISKIIGILNLAIDFQ